MSDKLIGALIVAGVMVAGVAGKTAVQLKKLDIIEKNVQSSKKEEKEELIKKLKV